MSEGRVRVGCYGVAVWDRRVLLTQLRPKPGGVSWWTLPGGGSEWGETPEETLAREVFEETGLIPETTQLIDIRSHVQERHPDGGRLHNYLVIYEMSLRGEPRVVEVDGSTVDARWLSAAELDGKPLVPGFVDLVEGALR